MSLLAHPSLSVRPPAVWPRPLGCDPLEPCELFSQRSALLDSNLSSFWFGGTACFTVNAAGWESYRPWDGHPPPTMAWAPTPTRWKPPSKICRTKNPESPRNLVGGVMINRRSAMQSLTPTSGISGASLPKGVSTSVVARLRCTFLLKNCAVFRIAFLRAAT